MKMLSKPFINCKAKCIIRKDVEYEIVTGPAETIFKILLEGFKNVAFGHG